MIKELIFATGNSNKVSEIQAILGEEFSIRSLKDINFNRELEEPFFTLEENARTKAEQLKEITGKDCFAEDSGLFVNALKGKPGVLSARYSGENASDGSNIELLLKNLAQISAESSARYSTETNVFPPSQPTGNSADSEDDRTAYFKTVIHLIQNGEHRSFVGTCQGKIIDSPLGDNGFGYDPIFVPNDIPNRTFAQLSKQEKNSISHRAKATKKFVEWLKT